MILWWRKWLQVVLRPIIFRHHYRFLENNMSSRDGTLILTGLTFLFGMVIGGVVCFFLVAKPAAILLQMSDEAQLIEWEEMSAMPYFAGNYPAAEWALSNYLAKVENYKGLTGSNSTNRALLIHQFTAQARLAKVYEALGDSERMGLNMSNALITLKSWRPAEATNADSIVAVLKKIDSREHVQTK